MNRGKHVLPHQPLAEQNCVFKVVAAPRHERDKNVPSESQIAPVNRRPVRQDLATLYLLADRHNRLLRDTGVLIGSFKFHEIVGIETDLVFFAARLFSLEVGLDDDPGGIHALHGACPLGQDHVSGIPCHDGLHPRPHQGGLGLDQGDGLALHVRAH